MTTFDNRENAFENKFAHDNEVDFKAVARRNKLLGLWAAGHLDLPEAERDAYAKSIVLADLELPGDEDVVQKILADFTAAGVTLTEKNIREELARLLPIAREQLRS